MKKRHRSARSAFTIIEVIVIVVILGVIAAVVAPRLLSRVGQSKQSVASTNASSLATAMNLYILDCGMPPDGAPISILLERPADVDEAAWKGPYVQSADALRDPWGNQFILVIPGQVNTDFDIVSYGSDGRPGGEGEAADVVNGRR
ncbi:MAG: type II secretion system major pseudopilin GspG [Phycisphaeraceae bacterium]|nr:type II secretion system major pseudopilin GspG [Phycisphaeraceae bacterium]